MGISAFDMMNGKQNVPPATSNSGGVSAFDLMRQQLNQKEAPGFWDKAWNLFDNVLGMQDPSNPNDIIGKVANAYTSGRTAQAGLLAGTQVLSTKGLHNIIPDAVAGMKDTWKTVRDDPMGVATSLPSALVDMANAPLKAISGVDWTSPNADPLTVEQQAQSFKDTGALIAQAVVTAGVTKVLGGVGDAAKLVNALKKVEDVSEISPSLLDKVASGVMTKKKAIAISASKGAIEGGVGGAAYGFVSGAGTDEQVKSMIASGLMFAPLGAFTHTVFGAKGIYNEGKAVIENARDINNWRYLQGNYNDSIKSIDTKASSIISSDDMASAVLKSQLSLDPNKPVVISNVTPEKYLNVADEQSKYDVHLFPYKDGTADALIVPKDSGIDGELFRTTGHYPGETVSWNGKNFTLELVTPEKSRVIGMDGEAKLVNTKTLRRVVNSNTDHLQSTPDTQWWNSLDDKTRFSYMVKAGLRDTETIDWWNKQAIDSNTPFPKIRSLDPSEIGLIRHLNDNPTSPYDKDILTSTITQEPNNITGLPEDVNRLENISRAESHRRSGYDKATQYRDQILNNLKDINVPDLSFKSHDGSVSPIMPDAADVLDAQYKAFKDGLMLDQKTNKISDINLQDPFAGMEPNRRVEYSRRLAQDLLEEQDPMTKNILKLSQEASVPTIGTFSQFETNALTNGYKIQIGDAGKIKFIDMGDPQQRVVASVNNIGEGLDFIAKSGQGFGNNLVPFFTTPTSFEALPNPRMATLPEPLGVVGDIMKTWDKLSDKVLYTMNWATQPDAIFKSIDNRLGTQLHSMFYDKTQAAKSLVNASAQPHMIRLAQIQKLIPKATIDQLHILGGWLETMTPEEIVNKGFNRPLNSQEISWAQMLSNSMKDGELQNDGNYNIEQAFKLRDFARDNPSPQAIDKYADSIGAGPQARNFHSIFEVITTNDEASLGKVTRLARALNEPENALSRSDYAAKHGMAPEMLKAGEQLDVLYRDLARTFNIPDDKLITNWMTHARLYNSNDFNAAKNMFAKVPDPEVQKFYAELARTGEISTYEQNPFEATKRYILAGMNAKHYNGIETEAKTYLNRTIEGLKAQAVATDVSMNADIGKLEMVSNSYINDLRGRVPLLSEATNEAFNHVDKKLGTTKTFRDKTMSILQVTLLGTQGGKIAAGVRDLMATKLWTFYRYGPDVMIGVMDEMAEAIRNDHALIRSGKVPGVSLEQLIDPTMNSSDSFLKRLDASKATTKITEFAMALSGQEFVYNTTREATYSYMYKKSAPLLRKVAGGELTIEEFLKQSGVEANSSPSVVAEVTTQIKSGKYDAVAEYLARDFMRQNTPTYGQGNNPTGWRRTIGRVAGQYGAYPVWLMGSMKEAATSGTLGDRFGRVARLGLATAAIAETKDLTGFDFSPWNIHPIYTGGPMFSTAVDAVRAMGPASPQQQEAANNLSRLLPYSGGNQIGELPVVGSVSLPSMDSQLHRQYYIPGSFAIGNVANIFEQQNPLALLGINKKD